MAIPSSPTHSTPPGRGLRVRLLGALLALAAPAALFLGYLGYTGFQDVQERGHERIMVAAETSALAAEDFLALSETLLSGLAADAGPELTQAGTCGPRVRSAQAMMSFFAHVTTVDEEGGIVCTSQEGADLSVRAEDRQWFRDVRDTRDFVISAPLESRLTGLTTLTLAAPVLSEDGEFLGAVAGALPVDELAAMVVRALPDTAATITIADTSHVVLARTRDAEEWRGRDLSAPYYPPIESGPNWVLFHADAPDGRRTVGRVDLPHRGWLTYASLEAETLYAAGRRDAIRTGLMGIALLALALFMAAAIYRDLSRSIAYLSESVKSAARGRPVALPASCPPEIRSVAEQFEQTLAARARAEERFHTFFQNAPFGAGISTEDGEIIAVNHALAEMLGYRGTEDLYSSGAKSLYPDPQVRADLLRKIREAGSVTNVEVEMMKKDGTLMLARVSGSFIRDDDGARYEIVGDDITELRRLEESERHRQKVEAISRLAGGVSHEINNVLTVIAGNAGVLEADLGPDHPSAADAREIAKAVERGTQLTRSLLAISRRDIAPPSALDVPEVLGEMTAMLERVLPETVRLSTRYDPTIRRVRMSRSHFEQMILNLVLNARDAMPDGGTVSISSHVEGDRMVIAVSDDGPGIDPEIAERIFEPYFTTKPRGGGTGLGLATVQGVVAQAGGTVDLDTTPDQGTTFSIRLPLADEPHGQISA